jgi:hypothetical protein
MPGRVEGDAHDGRPHAAQMLDQPEELRLVSHQGSHMSLAAQDSHVALRECNVKNGPELGAHCGRPACGEPARETSHGPMVWE